jgi:probable phosphoglycerate mutase
VSRPEVVLVRHGETEWSRTRRHTGRTDVQLTEAGRGEAQALKPRLEAWAFSRVLVSPLGRARETAELAGLSEGAGIRPELMELDYGDAEGLTTDQMREQTPGWTVWTHSTPGAETLSEVEARLRPLISELQAATGDVALVAHGHVLRVLAALWVEMPPSGGSRLVLKTGTVSVLGWERETPAIVRWNC